MTLEVRRHLKGYAVFNGDTRLSVRNNRDAAMLLQDKIQRDSKISVLVSMRPCLRCAQSFDSEGPHHRLCTKCRQVVGSVSRQMVG